MQTWPDHWIVRRARPDDATALARIRNATLSEQVLSFATEPDTDEQARERILAQDERHPLLVIECDGRIGGWAQIARFGSKPWHSGLGESSICLDGALRGKGLGRHLLAALHHEAAAQSYWKLIAMIFAHNLPSRRLFAGCGYREVGVLERHGRLAGRWIDVVLYERLILDSTC